MTGEAFRLAHRTGSIVARADGSRPLRGGIAHLLANCRSLGVPLIGLFDGVGRDTTGPGVLLKALDEHGLCSQEAPEQLAGFLYGCLALVGLLDGRAVLLDFVAHGHQLAARGRRLRRRATEAAATRRTTWHARHAPELRISRKGRGDHEDRKQKRPADCHGLSSHGLSSPLGVWRRGWQFYSLFGTNDGTA